MSRLSSQTLYENVLVSDAGFALDVEGELLACSALAEDNPAAYSDAANRRVMIAGVRKDHWCIDSCFTRFSVILVLLCKRWPEKTV